MIILITGGTRSGKSSYAQERALRIEANPVYLATARKWDDEFNQRIKNHQADRDDRWHNREEELFPSSVELPTNTCVIDCVTLWLTNIFLDKQEDINNALIDFKAEADKLAKSNASYFIVTNEIGMGLHADTEIGRKFADLQGWANQYLAKKATEVVFMVSGIPVKIK